MTPLQRIAHLTHATSTPSLNPISSTPWDKPLQCNSNFETIIPLKTKDPDVRKQYITDIKSSLNKQSEDNTTLVVATDGSRRRKRGIKRTGAGVVIRQGHTELASFSIGGGHKSTAYDGESLALLAGMRLAFRHCQEDKNVTMIHLYSDSISAIQNIHRSHAHSSQTLSLAFINLAKNFLKDSNHHIRIQWIPGHSGLEINDKADQLARRGCHRSDNILDSTLSYYAEKKSKMVLKGWSTQLKNSPLTGAFGEVTRYSPSTKPNRVFIQLQDQPEVFGRLTQLRTMHGYNPHYYARFNLPQDPLCICGHYLPPFPASRFRNHVLHNCEAYENYRHLLTMVSRDHQPEILLGSTKGLLATAKFLKETGAFSATGRPYQRRPPPDIPGLQLHEHIFEPP
jgi:ribonuclease HI